jgi:hypothetical protein
LYSRKSRLLACFHNKCCCGELLRGLQVPSELVQQFFKPRKQQDVIKLHDALTGPPKLPTAASKL